MLGAEQNIHTAACTQSSGKSILTSCSPHGPFEPHDQLIAWRTPRTAEISRSAAGTACFWMQEIGLLVVSITPDSQTMQGRRCVMRRFCSLDPQSALKSRRCQDFHVSGTHGRSRRLHPDTALGRPSAQAAGGKPSSVSASAVGG